MESNHNQEQPRNDTADQFVSMGFSLFSSGGFNQAIECFDKAIQLDRNHAKAWFGKGYALIFQGRYREAIKCFDKEIVIDYVRDYVLGEVWIMGGVFSPGVLERNEMDIFSPPLDQEEEDIKLQAMESIRSFEEEVVKCLDKVLSIYPNDTSVWTCKGYVINKLSLSQRQFGIEEAVKCLDKAIELDPSYAAAWFAKATFALEFFGKAEISEDGLVEIIKALYE